MKREVVEINIRGIWPTVQNGCAIFVGNDDKVFVIQVDISMGKAISDFIQGAEKERPLTHDLMMSCFIGLGVKVERVVITELRNSTYFARLILTQENELGRKLVEIDARPSDCLALAAAQKAPIYVSKELFEQVDDMSEYLERMNEGGGPSEE